MLFQNIPKWAKAIFGGKEPQVSGRYLFIVGGRGTLSVLACPECKHSDYLDHDLAVQESNPRAVMFSCGCGCEFKLEFARLYCGRCGVYVKNFTVKVGPDDDTLAKIERSAESTRKYEAPLKEPLSWNMFGICGECKPDPDGTHGGGGHFSFADSPKGE